MMFELIIHIKCDRYLIVLYQLRLLIDQIYDVAKLWYSQCSNFDCLIHTCPIGDLVHNAIVSDEYLTQLIPYSFGREVSIVR